MDFLVTIEVTWPPSNDERQKVELIAAEAARARQLADEGVLVRLWRIPGRWANVGIWRAESATRLDEAISSLPMSPWLDVIVVSLADHPNDPGRVQT
jgi:muconolactone D-isomerase